MSKATKIIFSLLTTSIFVLPSCSSKDKKIEWSKWYDNGDGTHSRHDINDIEHQETAPHEYDLVRYITEPTDVTPGEAVFQCSLCFAKKQQKVKPTGNYVFNQEVVDDKYLYKKCSDHSAIYYKSSVEGAYGNPDELFEHSDIDNGDYSEVDYIESDGRQFIDTGVNNLDKYLIYVNDERNSTLPDTYQRLEYLESQGKEYIDLPFGFTATDNIEACFSLSTKDSKDKYMVCPSVWNNNKNRFGMGVNGNFSCPFGDWSSGTTIMKPTTKNDGGKHKWEYSNLEFSISDLGVTFNCSGATFGGPTANLRLFYGYNAATVGKFYSYKHYKDGNLVINLVPAKNIETEELGMFDLLEKKFYTNAGQGTFKDGPVTADTGDEDLPIEYQEVEYLESTGTQHIEMPQVETDKFQLTCEFTTTEKEMAIIGHGVGDDSERWEIFTQKSDPTYNVWIKNVATYVSSVSASLKKTLTYDYSTHKLDIGGEDEIECTFASLPKYLFAYNNGDYHAEAKIYAYKAYKDSALVMDLIPCYRKTDNKPGLYDLVTYKFITNSGSGEFSCGPNNDRRQIDTDRNYKGEKVTSLPSYFDQLSYVESDKRQILDTGVVGKATIELRTRISSLSGTQTFGYGEEEGCFFGAKDKKYIGTTIKNGNTDTIIIDAGETIEDKAVITINEETPIELPLGDISEKTFSLFGAGSKNYSNSILYYAKIYQNGTLVRNYIPAVLKATMDVGLYDLVTEKFYTADETAQLKRGGAPFVNINTDHINVFVNNVEDIYKINSQKVRSYKIYNGTTLLRDYVAVIRNSDSKPGLYDLVSKDFYTSATEYDFKYGSQLQHILGEEKVLKEPTYCDEGESVFKCSVCGHEIHKATPRTSYKVTFVPDNTAIESIKIFPSVDPNHYENSLVAYTRNINTFNYSRFNAGVIFELPTIEGKEYEPSCVAGKIERYDDGRYRIISIKADLVVRIVQK